MEQAGVLDQSTPNVDRIRTGESWMAANVLARSFVREPLFAHLFEGCHDRQVVRAIAPWFRVWIGAYGGRGHIHTARLHGKLVGVGIRVPPHQSEPHALYRFVFAPLLMGCIARMAATSPRARNMLAIGSHVERRQPSQPFWLLAWVGIDPDYQRRGVGAALADEAVSVVDDAPAPAWLVTFGAHTRSIYEKRGFIVEGDFRPLQAGPIGWTMRRENPGVVQRNATESEAT